MIPIALAAFTLAASLAATPPVELTARTIGPAVNTQSEGRFAFDGSRFLAVWTNHVDFDPSEIHGAFLDAKGARVDANTLAITSDGSTPAVAYGDGHFLVVWATNASGTFARFVDADGTLSEPFAIGINAARGSLRVVSHNGVFLVIGTEESTLRAVLVGRGPAFTVLDHSSSFAAQPEVVVAWGTFTVIATTEDGHVVSIDVSDLGNVSAPRTLADVGSITELHAAARGAEVRVAWRREPSIESVTVTQSSVTPEAPIFTGTRAFQELAADANGYVYFYGDEDKTISRRVMPYDVQVPAGTVVHDALSNGTNLILLLDEPQGDVYAGSLTTQDYFVVSTAITSQSGPRVAAHLVVWAENDKLLANGVDVHATAPSALDVASNGIDDLVVWLDGQGVRGVRVSHSGALLDATPIQIANRSLIMLRVAVAWDGQSYVVVFDRTVPGRPPSGDIHAVRVAANGHVADHETPIGHSSRVELAIATNLHGSFIVWQADEEHIEGALLSQSDAVTPVTLPDPTGKAPDVAWNGDTYALVYEGGTSLRELRWALVNAEGSVRTPFIAFPTLGRSAFAPIPHFEVEPFADRFLVVFRDPTHFTQLAASQLRALTFDGDGAIVDPRTVLDGAASGFALAGSHLVTSSPIASTPVALRLFTREVVTTNARRRASGLR